MDERTDRVETTSKPAARNEAAAERVPPLGRASRGPTPGGGGGTRSFRCFTRRRTADKDKGGGDGPQLTIFRKVPQGEERLSDGALARSGDLLQIIYRSGGLRYGAILSVDGRGAVTQHLPVAGGKAVSLAAQDTLDYASELDDAPRRERFFFVAADIRFDLQEIIGQLNEGSTLASTAELHYFEFTLNKPSAP